MAAFGLRNQRGSCWVNATLQALFRIDSLQKRFTNNEADPNCAVEQCMEEIWNSEGDEGLKGFYECVKTGTMPAGDDIGDSHELLEFLCDKIKFLDNLLRFKVANRISCNHCSYSENKPDSLIYMTITPTEYRQSVSDAIVQAVKPSEIEEWKCDKCKELGCTQQFLIGTFPEILTFHINQSDSGITYSSILVVNKLRYALTSVVCFNGGHWWTYGRNMPPGQPWIEFNDIFVQRHDPQSFPVSQYARLLMYSRLNE